MTTFINHKFIKHQVDKNVESIILGTFNPDYALNDADFFYSRRRNFLWLILPNCFNETNLKNSTLIEKFSFMKKHKIDFVDIISKIQKIDNPIPDKKIDNVVLEWNNIIQLLENLPNIKRVCFTRCTFGGIPNIKAKVNEIKDYCTKEKIVFSPLISPSRFYSNNKQKTWTDFFKNK